MEKITLKRFRKLQKISQLELAIKIGYTQAHISTIEANKRALSEDFLEKMEEVFQYSKKGYILIGNVDKDNSYSNLNYNSGIKNSTIKNTIGDTDETVAELKNKLIEANAKIIELQEQLIEMMRENQKRGKLIKESR